MRVIIILSLFLVMLEGSAQSLRDSLFGGKLKPDSALLQKSGMDKGQKTEKDSTTATAVDSLKKKDTPETPRLNYQDNNKTWKKFIDEMSTVIHNEALSSKKIKRGTYSVLLEYEIGTDGLVSVTNLTSTPASEYLVEQIRENILANAPRLAPLVRDNKPFKSRKRQLLTFVKEKN